MALSESRASNNIVKDATVEAGTREKFIKAKDEKVKGELNKYSNESVQNSPMQEVKAAVHNASSKIWAAREDMNKKLSGLTPEKLVDSMGNAFNLNTAPINKTLGVAKKILCWDGNIDFSLQELIDALDIKFNFMLTWSICQRQGAVNPIDNLLRSVSRLENEINQLKNIDKRILNNLKQGIKGFIKKSGLPKQLQDCMLNNSFLQNAEQYRGRTSLNSIKNLLNVLNVDICKKSDEGIPTQVDTLTQTAMAPFVSGLAEYPKETMYAAIITLITTEGIDPKLVEAALLSSYQDKENTNTIKLLEMMAIIQATQKATKINKTNTIGSVNSLLANTNGSTSALLDNALQAIDEERELSKDELLSMDMDRFNYVPTIDPNILLKNMADDLTGTTDILREFENLKKLLSICLSGFDPNDYVYSMSKSSSIIYLVNNIIPNTKKDKLITNAQENIESTEVKYLDLTSESNDAFTNAYLLNQVEELAVV